jgi:Uma2 family endonuclease
MGRYRTMSAAATTLLTADDFWHLPDNGKRLELVRGEVVETMPTNGEHGAIVGMFIFFLIQWARPTGAGIAGTETGFILDRDPDVVRAPDVHFVRAERLPMGRPSRQFYDLAPDLAVEVISPSETAEGVQEKVRDYLAAGSSLAVLVYPRTRLLIAHAADGSSRTYREDEVFSDATVLPGFSCRVAEVFT